MLSSVPIYQLRSSALALLGGLLLACAGTPASGPAPPQVQTSAPSASVTDVPALAHMWLAAPDTVYEGRTFLVEIVLADGQGRPLAGTQSVRLRPSGERMHLANERVQIENGRGSTRVLGASAGERDLYIAGRCTLEDGTYLTGVSNTIVVIPARP
jgi:hypothetical protein